MQQRHRFYYGWVVLGISFAAMTLAYGARHSFSLFYVVILDEFQASRAGGAGIYSLNLVLYGLMAPFSGGLADRFGPRRVLIAGAVVLAGAMFACSAAQAVYQFYIFFGIMGAVGTCLIGYAVHASVLPHWFIRRRGLAFGLVMSGWGASQLLVPPLQSVIQNWGWRPAFVILGLLIGGVLLPVVAVFARHRPQDLGLLPDGKAAREHSHKTDASKGASRQPAKGRSRTSWTLKRALKSRQFWLMFAAFFCVFGLVENILIVHQIALIEDAGLSRAFGAAIVGLWGLVTIVGNLSGLFSDRWSREGVFAVGCLVEVAGLAALLLLQARPGPVPAYLYAAACGLGIGIAGPVLGAALADVFQGRHFGAINGCVIMGYGLGGLVGPWWGGWMFDRTGSYVLVLGLMIASGIAAAWFLWLAAPRRSRTE